MVLVGPTRGPQRGIISCHGEPVHWLRPVPSRRSGVMRRYLLQRLVWLVLVLLGASLLTFTLGAITPGDPAQIIRQNRTGSRPPSHRLTPRAGTLGSIGHCPPSTSAGWQT